MMLPNGNAYVQYVHTERVYFHKKYLHFYLREARTHAFEIFANFIKAQVMRLHLCIRWLVDGKFLAVLTKSNEHTSAPAT
jgi:hypothetical protein